MRGASNAISAVFVIAIILGIVYLSTEAMMSGIRIAAESQKQIIDYRMEAAQVGYGAPEVNGDVVTIPYTGGVGEYAIRLFCWDVNTHKKQCVVPLVYSDAKSVSYWGPGYEAEYNIHMDFNVGKCPDNLASDMNKEGILCYIVGMKSDKELYIKR